MSFPLNRITLFSVGAATSLTVLEVLADKPWSTSYFIRVFAGSFVASVVGWAAYTVFLFPKFFSPLRHLPGPKDDHWLLGQYPRIAAEPTGIPQIDWVNNIPNEGIIRYTGLLNQERLLINSPKALSEVLVTKNYDFEKPSAFRWSIGRILGIGVLLAEGEEHKFQRKNLMPAFAFRHVKDLYSVFWKKSREGAVVMTEHILAEAAAAQPDAAADPEKPLARDTAVIEAGAWSSRITLDIIGIAGLGHDFNAINDPDGPLSQIYQNVFKPSKQAQILGLLGLVLPGWLVAHLPVKRNGDVAQASAVIRDTCRDLISNKKAKLARKEPADMDILSTALESGAFTDENLVDQMMTFLAAGHETTASAMTWVIYLLCLNPEVQSRLRAEVRERLPSISSDADITAVDIDRMPYLLAVCNEALRYYAPVPMTLREAAVDTTILGHHVPKGTRIMLCPWATNKDASLWGPDAHKFNPDRWLTPDGSGAGVNASGGASSNFAYMTFLHGPRSCIGQAFAKAEFACILATWIGRFEFSLRDEEMMDEKKVDIKGGVTARPAKGLYVHAKVLDGW
ncbi:cytochrome P450 4A12A [Plectosphaerella plurivora]|uniref:Cytochrome P450 4A12A n=1 Tax=Plectosphaerella plurivora TaxID=936078 RepID=A0A9P8V586_9PEZI|nr:cytochrome P450 4A12A [Plectosphaerella plurivora]